MTLFGGYASAAQSTSYDPYADAVTDTSPVVTDADNAVGAPNGTSASLAGLGAVLTLDMGASEEGTQTLRVHLGRIGAQANVTVAFLDEGKTVIASETRQLGIDLSPSVQNFAYNWTSHNKVYRYVRISSSLGAGVNVDAVEALGYLGSTPTQDTDGDGRPDRDEQKDGTNPLVQDPAPNPTTVPAPIPGANQGTGGVSQQVNTPPAASNDQDGDGMADDWERTHGLNPSDAKDATGDPDHDGLNNLSEFKIGSDPQKMDTDGDGMPDKWEYDHGLDVNKNDADADPDGDYLTNLGEYRYGTDPHKADDLHALFGKTGHHKSMMWCWLLLILLLAVVAAWLLSKRTGRPRKLHKKDR